jgi:DNA polymerase-3 subunit epsilon
MEAWMEQVKSLHLKRPLVFFDLETTGTKVGVDRIVEMALIKVQPDGSVERKPEEPGKRILVHPEMPIPLESSLVHGVYDADVADAPTFGRIAPGLLKWLHGCDLAGFNSNRFDVPMLAEEFLRVGIDFGLEDRHLVDVQNIFHRMEQRTLRAAYKFYCDKDLEGAHEALPDTTATLEVFLAQVERYKEYTVLDSRGETVGPLPSDVAEIASFCRMQNNADLMGRLVFDDEGHVLFNFGKHSGQRVKDVLDRDPGYFGWMMQGDFPRYTKRILQQVKEGKL